MPRCRIRFYVPGEISFFYDKREEASARDLVDEIKEGECPPWVVQSILNGIRIGEIEVDEVAMGDDLAPGEELNFD
jgi:hypothetical protein